MDAFPAESLPPYASLIRFGPPDAAGASPTLLRLGALPGLAAAELVGGALPAEGLPWTAEGIAACTAVFAGPAPSHSTLHAAAAQVRDVLQHAGLFAPWLEWVHRCAEQRQDALALFDVHAAHLRPLPWELLAGEEEPRPFCVGDRPAVSFARLAPASRGPRPAHPAPASHSRGLSLPLRVLVVVAENAPAMCAEEEVELIRARLRVPVGEWHLEVLRTPDAADLVAALREVAPQVLHVIGHHESDGAPGTVPVRPGPGREPWRIRPDNVADLLNSHRPRLVVLNACGTAGPAGGAWSPLSAALLAAGVAAVVGMAGGIDSRAACRFSDEFYAALAERESVDRAVRRARRRLLWDCLDRRDWARPVLSVRRAPHLVLHRAATRTRGEADALFSDEKRELRHAVDRVGERRKLFDGFGPAGPRTPLTLVSGQPGAGKATLVRAGLHTWYRNGATALWVDPRELGRTASWRDVVLLVRDRLAAQLPYGDQDLALFDHRFAQLHSRWETDPEPPWLPHDPGRRWQDEVPGNSTARWPDRRHAALGRLADLLRTAAAPAGLVLALGGLDALEDGILPQLLAPHLLRPLVDSGPSRVRVVLAGTPDHLGSLPYDLRQDAREVPLGRFTDGLTAEVIGDYGRVRGLDPARAENWTGMASAAAKEGGGLYPAELNHLMLVFSNFTRPR